MNQPPQLDVWCVLETPKTHAEGRRSYFAGHSDELRSRLSPLQNNPKH